MSEHQVISLLALGLLSCSSQESQTDPAPQQAIASPATSSSGSALIPLEALPPRPSEAPLSDRLSKDNGFRSATMGKARGLFEGLQRRKKWDDKALGLRAYAKTKEYRLVGAATIDRIVYRFHDDQLFSVELLSDDLLECSTLRDVLTEMYGPSHTSKTGYDQVAWWGEDLVLLFTSLGDCSAEYTWRSRHRSLISKNTPTPTADPPKDEEPTSAAE